MLENVFLTSSLRIHLLFSGPFSFQLGMSIVSSMFTYRTCKRTTLKGNKNTVSIVNSNSRFRDIMVKYDTRKDHKNVLTASSSNDFEHVISVFSCSQQKYLIA